MINTRCWKSFCMCHPNRHMVVRISSAQLSKFVSKWLWWQKNACIASIDVHACYTCASTFLYVCQRYFTNGLYHSHQRAFFICQRSFSNGQSSYINRHFHVSTDIQQRTRMTTHVDFILVIQWCDTSDLGHVTRAILVMWHERSWSCDTSDLGHVTRAILVMW
jgi:hypothetical protein